MSAPGIIANMARGWNRTPTGVSSGTERTGVSAALWTHDGDGREEVWGEPDSEHHIVPLNFVTTHGVMELDGRLIARHTTFGAGTIHLVRAGQRPRAVFAGRLRCLHIYIPDRLLRSCASDFQGQSTKSVELIDPKCAQDVAIERIGRELLVEMREGQPLSRLRVDSLGQDIAIQLLRNHSSFSGTRALTRELTRGGLAPWQVRRVVECLDAHLADDISLAALAQLVGLSPNHFCTAFRVSLGEPPHRYLVRRRIERAKELLADPRLSVTEVALAVGFGSSAHFATTFRKEVGATPSAFRRDRML